LISYESFSRSGSEVNIKRFLWIACEESRNVKFRTYNILGLDDNMMLNLYWFTA